MKAVIQEAGHLVFRSDFPQPIRKPGEILVNVRAAGINPIEFKLRTGAVAAPARLLPKIPGADMAGVVAEADASSKFKVGDKVFAYAAGTYAQYCCVRESALLPMPSKLSFEEAAAVPLAGMTAWQALTPAGREVKGRLLVQAGAGGVGTFVIQIAKARGLHVTATCSAKNEEFLKSLGCDEVVDYSKQRVDELYKDKPFDAVVDLVGGETQVQSLKVTARNGYYANVFGTGWIRKHPNLLLLGLGLGGSVVSCKLRGALGMGPRYHFVLLRPNTRDLAALSKLIEEGKVKPIIDQVLPLSEALKAQDYLAQGHARGKVVLKMPEE